MHASCSFLPFCRPCAMALRDTPVARVGSSLRKMADDVASAFDDSHKNRSPRHPVAVLFHLVFRVSALVLYLVAHFVTHMGEMSVMITIILLLAVDFWTVKNITGRILAGLRWWNKVEEDGTSTWVFEWRKNHRNVSTAETYIFWIGLFLCPLLWLVFLVTSLLKINFTWMLLASVGIILNGANVVGYVKCRRDAGSRLSSMATQFIGKKVLEQTMSQGQRS